MKMLLTAGALALGISSAASAAIVVTTYEGTISEGTDDAGLLGTAGADLTGLAYAATFKVDTSINFNAGTDIVSDYEEAHANGTTTPMLSAIFSVNGGNLALALQPSAFAFLRLGNLLSHGSFFAGAPQYNFLVNSPLLPDHLNQGFSAITPTSSDFFILDGDTGFFAAGNVSLVSATVQGVPEPATWALMILGFGGAGAALRRSRRSAPALS